MHFSTGTVGAALLSLLVAQVAATPLAGDAQKGPLKARGRLPEPPIHVGMCTSLKCMEGRRKDDTEYTKKLPEAQGIKKKKPGKRDESLLKARAPIGFVGMCTTEECRKSRSRLISEDFIRRRKAREAAKAKQAAAEAKQGAPNVKREESLLEARGRLPSPPIFPAVVCSTLECMEGRKKAMDEYGQKLIDAQGIRKKKNGKRDSDEAPQDVMT